MRRLIARTIDEIAFGETRYGITVSWSRTIVLLPLVIAFLYAVAIVLPSTRQWAEWMQRENRPIEFLTFLFLLAAAIRAGHLSWRQRTNETLVYLFYAVFSAGCFLVAMEEIAWGQSYLAFETPAALRDINVQNEFTFHNIRGLQGHSEFFRVAFGIGGLLGVWMSLTQSYRKIGAPFILLSWFLVISVLALLDLYNDYFWMPGRLDHLIRTMAEFVEMLIGMSAFLYVWLNARMFATHRQDGIDHDT